MKKTYIVSKIFSVLFLIASLSTKQSVAQLPTTSAQNKLPASKQKKTAAIKPKTVKAIADLELRKSPEIEKKIVDKKVVISKKQAIKAVPEKLSTTESQDPKIPTQKISIRVLLEEHDALPKRLILISSQEGFILESPAGMKESKAHLRHKKLRLIIKKNIIYVRCKDHVFRRIKNNSLTIAPIIGEEKGILHLNDKSYHGSITIRINEETNSLLVINKLNLDDYIYSVLRFESLPYWPLEMHKVQAVASRTYALYHMQKARNKNKNNVYDIKNSNFHQVYNGAHKFTHLRKAVEATHNMILTYKDLIALTMFDICCGGVIPSRMKQKDHDKPYLFRKNQCNYCQNQPSYNWKKTFRKEDFLDHLKNNQKLSHKLRKIGKIADINIKEKDGAGITHSVMLKGSNKSIKLTGHEIKSSLSPVVKSLAFSVKKVKNNIEISGNGYGHNIGLCQFGSRELVKRGWSYKKILALYYPNTTLVRLKS